MAASFKAVALLKGLGLHIADINILSGGTVPLTNLHPSAPVQINDTIIDSNGDAYTIATVTDENVTVGTAIQGVTFRGPAGPAGTGLTIKGSVAAKDDLPAENNNAGDSYLVAGHLWTWNGTEWVDGGNIQGPSGEGFHTVAKALADDGTVAIADLVPNASVTVGDSVIDSAGDVRPITATDATNATLGKKTVNLKGAAGVKGDKGDTGETGAAGVNGVSIHYANVDVSSSQAFPATALTPGNPAVNDLVVDAQGQLYSVVSVADGNVTPSDALKTADDVAFTLKGADGAKGDKGDPGVKGDKGDQGVAGVRGSKATFVADTSTITDALPGDFNINPDTGVLSVYSE